MTVPLTASYWSSAVSGFAEVSVWAAVFQSGSRVAVSEVLNGSVSEEWGQDITSTVELVLPWWDGWLPDVSVVGTDRRFGDGTWGEGIYGDYVHSEYASLVLPIKTKVEVYYKVKTDLGEEFEFNLGRFTVTQVQFGDTEEGVVIRLYGSDVSWDLSEAKFLAPYQIAPGTSLNAAISGLVAAYLPGTAVSLPASSYTTPLLTYLPGGDVTSVWRACADIALAAGLELHASRSGDLVGIETEDDPLAVPSATLTDVSNVVSLEQEPNADQFCNTVLAFGESGSEVPVYAVAQNVSGPFGTAAVGRAVTREYRSPAIVTTAHAQNAANSLLRKWSRVSELLSVGTTPVPHVSVGDYVSLSGLRFELEDVFRVQGVQIPLGPGDGWTVRVRREIV